MCVYVFYNDVCVSMDWGVLLLVVSFFTSHQQRRSQLLYIYRNQNDSHLYIHTHHFPFIFRNVFTIGRFILAQGVMCVLLSIVYISLLLFVMRRFLSRVRNWFVWWFDTFLQQLWFLLEKYFCVVRKVLSIDDSDVRVLLYPLHFVAVGFGSLQVHRRGV